MTQKLNDNGTEWEADTQQTDGVPLVDSGTGKPIILRKFEFELPPGMEMPSNEQILEAHKGKITTFLWKDDMVQIMEARVKKAKDQRHFMILVPCQPRSGSAIIGNTTTLQDIMKPK